MVTVPFGVNAWFEPGDKLMFRPAVLEAGKEYLLTFDVSVLPYGASGSQLATWFSGALINLGYQSIEDGKPRLLTLEIQGNETIEVIGDSAVSVWIDAQQWQRAASLPLAAGTEDSWFRAIDPDFTSAVDVLSLLRDDPQHPLRVARCQLRVRLTDVDLDPWLAVRLLEGEMHEPLDDTQLLYYRESKQLTLVWGSGPPETADLEEMGAPEAISPAEDGRMVTVFYGTDRKNTGSAKLSKRYSGELGEFELGVLQVNIPKGHEEGEIERPIFGWHRLESTDRHMMLLSVMTLGEAEFYAQLTQGIGVTHRKEAFVFIHGYNVNFEDAALRVGQMAYDFQRLGVDAVPVLYSWPSAGSTAAYVADLDSSDWSARHLADFLDDLRERSGAEVLHLIAHSMGNRVLTRALSRLAERRSGARFHEIVLAAPDVNVDIFRQLVREIGAFSRRMTLYANSGDKALDTSEALRIGRHRAGDVEDGKIIVVEGVESIDASNLDTGFMGHSYFAEQQLMIRDISLVLAQSKTPEGRQWLRRKSDGDAVWWAFDTQ